MKWHDHAQGDEDAKAGDTRVGQQRRRSTCMGVQTQANSGAARGRDKEAGTESKQCMCRYQALTARTLAWGSFKCGHACGPGIGVGYAPNPGREELTGEARCGRRRARTTPEAR
jgi:hypothetical protein